MVLLECSACPHCAGTPAFLQWAKPWHVYTRAELIVLSITYKPTICLKGCLGILKLKDLYFLLCSPNPYNSDLFALLFLLYVLFLLFIFIIACYYNDIWLNLFLLIISFHPIIAQTLKQSENSNSHIVADLWLRYLYANDVWNSTTARILQAFVGNLCNSISSIKKPSHIFGKL